MSDTLRKVISGKKIGDLLLPPSPMSTRSKRAAAAAVEPESNIDSTGVQPTSSNPDSTSESYRYTLT